MRFRTDLPPSAKPQVIGAYRTLLNGASSYGTAFRRRRSQSMAGVEFRSVVEASPQIAPHELCGIILYVLHSGSQ